MINSYERLGCDVGNQIFDENECQAAVAALGKAFEGSNAGTTEYAHWPSGCFYVGPNGESWGDNVFFIGWGEGQGGSPEEHESHLLVCKTTGVNTFET